MKIKKYLFTLLVVSLTIDVNAQIADTLSKKLKLPNPHFDVPAQFPNGDFSNYITSHLKYPVNNIKSVESQIRFLFYIDTLGNAHLYSYFEQVSPEIDDEFSRVINQMPKWSPATLNGKPVVEYIDQKYHVVVDADHKTITAKSSMPPPTVTITKPVAGSNNQVYTTVETVPEFPGGMAAFGKFLGDNIHYPEAARKNKIQGRVIVKFIVETDGSLTDITVIKSPSDDLSQESKRVLNQSPKWTPGIQNSRPVRVQFAVPINFSLGH